MPDQSSTLLTIAQNIVSAINALKAALAPSSSGTAAGGTTGQIEYNNSGILGGFTASGDATINTGTGALTLTSVITAGGPTGDATHVPTITYDAKGRLTAVTTTVISGTIVTIVGYNGSQTINIAGTSGWVRMWSGTGGSGGAASNAATGGTGAGAYIETLLTGLTVGNTLTYTQGGAGTAGAATPTNGGNGGNSVLASGTQTITTLTATGSNGSLLASSGGGLGTAGGTPSGPGNIFNLFGQPGTNGLSTGTVVLGGSGGATQWSYGANGVGTAGSATAGQAGQTGGLVISWFK